MWEHKRSFLNNNALRAIPGAVWSSEGKPTMTADTGTERAWRNKGSGPPPPSEPPQEEDEAEEAGDRGAVDGRGRRVPTERCAGAAVAAAAAAEEAAEDEAALLLWPPLLAGV